LRICLDCTETRCFVAALLAVLLLEDDCGDTPGLALLGGQVPPRGGARHGKDHLVVLGVRARVVEEVVIRRGEGVRLVEVRRGDGRLGDGGEVAAEGGGSRFGGVAGGAWLGGVGF
jgi:hypothetical protein